MWVKHLSGCLIVSVLLMNYKAKHHLASGVIRGGRRKHEMEVLRVK